MAIKVEIKDEEIIRIGIDAGIDFCKLMARELLECEGIVAISIKRRDPVLNLVVHSEIEEQDVNKKIQAVKDFYRQLYVAWTWTINPLSKPSSLAQHLEQHDFAYLEQYPSLYLDLSKASFAKLSPQYPVREAKADDALKEWIKPINEGFPSSDNGEGFRELNANLPHGEGTSLRQYMIFYKHQIVSAGTLYLGKEAAMIYNVATRATVRKQGFGTALTLYALQEAKRLGYKHCFLDSSERGINIYRKLGFRVYAISKVYALRSLIRKR